MTLKDIQKDVHEWTKQFTPQYWPPLEMFASLAEETGEVGRELNHLYGNKKKKPTENKGDLGQELSDLLFSICCIANAEKIDLNEQWEKMMKKNNERDKDRFKKASD